MEITVKNNQCLPDIALQAFGSAESVFDIAEANNISITEDLNAGQILKIPASSAFVQRRVAEYYAVNGIIPATAITNENQIAEGIGFWAIEYDFIIS